MKTYFYIILFGAFILIAFDKCDSIMRFQMSEKGISKKTNIDYDISRLKSKMYKIENLIIEYKFSIDSLYAVRSLEEGLLKKDLELEYQYRPNDTTDVPRLKSIIKRKVNSNSDKMQDFILIQNDLQNRLKSSKKSLDSLMQLKASQQ